MDGRELLKSVQADAEATWRGYNAKPCRPPHLVPGFDEIQAAYVLADAYLAEHPADDEEPVDEAWLRSIGFVRDDSDPACEHETNFLSLVDELLAVCWGTKQHLWMARDHSDYSRTGAVPELDIAEGQVRYGQKRAATCAACARLSASN